MKHLNYLAQYRKKYALSQLELGDLLGLTDSPIAKYERGARRPPLVIILALEAVFGVPASNIFRDLYAEVLEGVISRAAELDRAVADKTDEASQKKLTLLSEIMGRAVRTTEL
jgi:transcriptional regulator with XRE-family HTH domain